jgi:hypothetical protein
MVSRYWYQEYTYRNSCKPSLDSRLHIEDHPSNSNMWADSVGTPPSAVRTTISHRSRRSEEAPQPPSYGTESTNAYKLLSSSCFIKDIQPTIKPILVQPTWIVRRALFRSVVGKRHSRYTIEHMLRRPAVTHRLTLAIFARQFLALRTSKFNEGRNTASCSIQGPVASIGTDRLGSEDDTSSPLSAKDIGIELLSRSSNRRPPHIGDRPKTCTR